MTHPQKRYMTHNHLYLDVAEITIRPLVLVIPHAVDFEAGDWHKNYVSHFSVDWIKGSQELTCPRTKATRYYPFLGIFPTRNPVREGIDFLTGNRSFSGDRRIFI
ncbi:hypothetical protein TNCV_4637301 [Trichonephila clavipes]|nr:hypothetical protein TNCV_4637301 [Trichonephila clavipes]